MMMAPVMPVATVPAMVPVMVATVTTCHVKTPVTTIAPTTAARIG